MATKVSNSIYDKDHQEWLLKELHRALHFIEIQLLKGWNITEALRHVESSFGNAVYLQVLFAFQRNSNN